MDHKQRSYGPEEISYFFLGRTTELAMEFAFCKFYFHCTVRAACACDMWQAKLYNSSTLLATPLMIVSLLFTKIAKTCTAVRLLKS